MKILMQNGKISKAIIGMILGLIFSCKSSSNDSSSSTTQQPKTATEIKQVIKSQEEQKEALQQDLKKVESTEPLKYLSANYNLDENLLGMVIIKGTFDNSATMATFKDIIVKVTFFSKTDTDLGSEEHTIFDFVSPSSSTKFKIKTEKPSHTKKIGVEIIGATASN